VFVKNAPRFCDVKALGYTSIYYIELKLLDVTAWNTLWVFPISVLNDKQDTYNFSKA
jgi:hypothetical protein